MLYQAKLSKYQETWQGILENKSKIQIALFIICTQMHISCPINTLFLSNNKNS